MYKALLDTDTFSEMFKQYDPMVATNARTYRRAFGRYTVSATAILNGLELVTGNTRHYDRVRQLGDPLTLANWRV